jgi:hypothetical protein
VTLNEYSAGPEFGSRRPLPLTLFCMLGWLAIAFAVGRIVSQWEAFSALPPVQVFGAPVALAVAAVALVGYWLMRRWGLWLALIAVLARVVAGLVGTLPLQPADLIWPGVIVVLGLVYFRRLR